MPGFPLLQVSKFFLFFCLIYGITLSFWIHADVDYLKIITILPVKIVSYLYDLRIHNIAVTPENELLFSLTNHFIRYDLFEHGKTVVDIYIEGLSIVKNTPMTFALLTGLILTHKASWKTKIDLLYHGMILLLLLHSITFVLIGSHMIMMLGASDEMLNSYLGTALIPLALSQNLFFLFADYAAIFEPFAIGIYVWSKMGHQSQLFTSVQPPIHLLKTKTSTFS